MNLHMLLNALLPKSQNIQASLIWINILHHQWLSFVWTSVIHMYNASPAIHIEIIIVQKCLEEEHQIIFVYVSNQYRKCLNFYLKV